MVADHYVLTDRQSHAPNELDQVNTIPAVRAVIRVQIKHRVRVSGVQCGKGGYLLMERLARRVVLVGCDHADNKFILWPLQMFARFFSIQRLEDFRIHAVRRIPNVQPDLLCHALAELAHHNRLCGLPYLCQNIGRHRLMVDRKPGEPGQFDVLVLDHPRVHQCHNRVGLVPLRVRPNHVLPVWVLEIRINFYPVDIQHAALYTKERRHAYSLVKQLFQSRYKQFRLVAVTSTSGG